MKKNNICKSSRTERHKKFNKFKDKLHKSFGNKTFTGLGIKKPMFCSICKKRVYKLYGIFVKTKIIDVCKECKNMEELWKIQ